MKDKEPPTLDSLFKEERDHDPVRAAYRWATGRDCDADPIGLREWFRRKRVKRGLKE